MRLKSTKIIKIYFVIFFLLTVNFLISHFSCKVQAWYISCFPTTSPAAWGRPGRPRSQLVQTCTSSSVSDLAVFSVNPPLLFLFYFFFVPGPSVPLPHNRDATSDKKRDKKNLLSLIYLPLALLVSLKFSSQTNFKLKMQSHHCDWLRPYSACYFFCYCGSLAAWLECLIWGLCPSTMRALEWKDGTTLAPNDLFCRYNDVSKEQIIWPKLLPLMRRVHIVESQWWRQTLSDIQEQI